MKTISTQKNGTGGLEKSVKHRKGGIEMVRGPVVKGIGDLDTTINTGNPWSTGRET